MVAVVVPAVAVPVGALAAEVGRVVVAAEPGVAVPEPGAVVAVPEDAEEAVVVQAAAGVEEVFLAVAAGEVASCDV
jgi:hypothetical protein